MPATLCAALIVLLASAASAGLLSRRLFPLQTSTRWLCLLILWATLLIVPVQVAGALQLGGVLSQFTMAGLAVAQVAILLACYAIVRYFGQHAQEPLRRPSHTQMPRYVWVTAAMVALSYAIFAVDLLTSFPSGSDALGYHYLRSVRLLQEGRFDMFSPAFQFNLPANVEIGNMPFFATGIQSLGPVFNWLGVAVLALSVYGIAMRLWKHREAAVLAALLVLSLPMVQYQAFSGYIDVTGSAFLFAAVALWLERDQGSSRGPSLPVLLAASLAAGLSIGSKPTFYFYGLFVFALMTWDVMRQHRRTSPRNYRRMTLGVAVVGLGFLLPAAFWIAEGLHTAGNPVYPIQVQIAGRTLFRGVPTGAIVHSNASPRSVYRAFEWMAYPWMEYKRTPGYLLIPYSTGDGVGGAFAAFVPLAIACLVIGFLRRRLSRLEAGLLMFWLVLLAGWWVLMNPVLRFGIPVWILGLLLTVPMLIRMAESPQRKWFRPLVAASVTITCMISAFVPLHSLLGRIRTSEWSRASYYGYPAMIDRLPPGSVVLNRTGVSTQNFALAGHNLTNRVITDLEAPPDLSGEFLRRHRVDYVVTNSEPGEQEASVPGATVIHSETVRDGEQKIEWKIWRVNKQLNQDRAP